MIHFLQNHSTTIYSNWICKKLSFCKGDYVWFFFVFLNHTLKLVVHANTYCNTFNTEINNKAVKLAAFIFWGVCNVFAPLKNFFTHLETPSLPMKGWKFWPMLGTYGYWLMRHLVTRETWSSARTIDTHSCSRAFGIRDLTTCFIDLGLSYVQPSACGANALTDCATAVAAEIQSFRLFACLCEGNDNMLLSYILLNSFNAF